MQAGRLVLRKAWSALLTIGFVLVLNFFLFRVLPGDPARAGIKDPRMTRAAQAAIHERFGLDKPVLNCLASLNPLRRGPCLVNPLQTQFFIYINNLLHGELGISYHTKIPVGQLLRALVEYGRAAERRADAGNCAGRGRWRSCRVAGAHAH